MFNFNSDKSIKVFVYGSLKKGLYNHRYLKNSSYLGDTYTKNKYIMFNLKHYPALIKSSKNDQGYKVKGEVYEINNDTLKRLDELEGYPDFYDRELILLENGDRAYIYYIKNNNKEDFEYYKRIEPPENYLNW